MRLRQAKVFRTSFDRTNLQISVHGMGSGSPAEQMQPTIARLRKQAQPTIVYCATTREVEKIADVLGAELPCSVAKYHGKLGHAERNDAHMAFLTGRVQVIVATVAFGMGIDKPDIRAVVHYGPPKTFEEYYQQIGRAGRDGLQSHCDMYYSDNQFGKYFGDFYLGKLTPKAKAATMQSIQAFQNFTNDRKVCRRRQLVEHLSGGIDTTQCETDSHSVCDTCARAQSGQALTVDLTQEARIVLQVLGNRGKPTTAFVDEARQRASASGLGRKRGADFWKQLLPIMKVEGYVAASSTQGAYGSYTTYSRGPKAQVVDRGGKILLTPPDSVIKERKIFQQKMRKLEDQGVDISKIPAQELKDGNGPVLQAELLWINMLSRFDQSDPTRAKNLRELLARMQRWRDAEAVALVMSPQDVLPDYLARKVAYSQPTCKETLVDLGVRGHRVEDLIAIIKDAQAEFGWEKVVASDGSAGKLVLPSAATFPAWDKGGLMDKKGLNKLGWCVSTERFLKGQSLERIAVDGGAKGRSIQKGSVVKHVLTGAVHGMMVDFQRLAKEADVSPPNEVDWETIGKCFLHEGKGLWQSCADTHSPQPRALRMAAAVRVPDRRHLSITSPPHPPTPRRVQIGEDVLRTDWEKKKAALLLHTGAEAFQLEFGDRTDADKAVCSAWFVFLLPHATRAELWWRAPGIFCLCRRIVDLRF